MKILSIYSIGAAAGPVVAVSSMTAARPAGLLVFSAAFSVVCAGAELLFGLWRQTRTLPDSAEQQQSYPILAWIAPMSATLDPPAPGEPQEAE